MEVTKVENIDFTIKESGDRKIIFRFRPRNSNCHSFNDKPPKEWKDVYKVYYSYQILDFYDDTFDVVFDENCDECSVIGEVANRCKLLSEGKKQVKVSRKDFDEEEVRTIKLLNDEMFPIGDGTSWFIRLDPKRRTMSRERLYEISLFNGYSNTGYRFWLTKERIGEFGKYLNNCCEYMLSHGDPI